MMKWKDSNDAVGTDADTADDLKTDSSFSMTRNGGVYQSSQNAFQGRKVPALLVGGGVLLLVILLVWMFFGSGDNANLQQINVLESRINGLEGKVASLESLAQTVNAEADQEKSVTELTKRIAGLEEVFTKEIDSLSKQVSDLKTRKAAPPEPVKPAAPVKSPPPQPAPAPAGSQKETYHVVQAGENLYRISLRYHMKLEELLRLNGLKPGVTIKPGQKLLVNPQ